jgi:hypothetical protein
MTPEMTATAIRQVVGADSALTQAPILEVTHQYRGSSSTFMSFRTAMQGQSKIGTSSGTGSIAGRRQQPEYTTCSILRFPHRSGLAQSYRGGVDFPYRQRS